MDPQGALSVWYVIKFIATLFDDAVTSENQLVNFSGPGLFLESSVVNLKDKIVRNCF